MLAVKVHAAFAIILVTASLAFGQTTQPTTQPTAIPVHMMCTLVTVDGNNLSVIPKQARDSHKGTDADQITLTINTNDQIRIDGDVGTVADLKPGMILSVQSLHSSRRLPARLFVMANAEGLFGVVSRIEGTNIVLKPARDKTNEITVATDESTQIHFLGATVNGQSFKPRTGSLDDLKPGMRVKVLPETGVAKKILAVPVPEDKAATTKPDN